MACALTKATSPDKETTTSPGRRGDVAVTSPRLLLSCGDVSATSPAVSKVGQAASSRVAVTSPQRLLSLLGPPAGLGDVADKISLRDVAATDGDVAETSP